MHSQQDMIGKPSLPALTHRLRINGRFLGRSVTGVDRFAGEWLRAVDRLRQAGDPCAAPLDIRLLVPRGVEPPAGLATIPCDVVGRLHGHAWEQLELPVAARDGWLVNLCNSGPLATRRQLVVIHDVATFRVGEAYSRAFRAWYGRMVPWLYRRAGRVATVSRFSRSEMAELFGPRDDVIVLPEGVDHVRGATADPSILDRHGLRQRPYVLAVSSQSPHKNFSAVVAAVQSIGDAPFDVVVAGGQNPKVFGGGAPLPDFVRYVGYVSDAELVALYRNAACFVFPSRYEGYGLPPVEAMACGCPVLAARAASMPEVLGEAAIYFDPGDPAELAARLTDLMADASERERRKQLGLNHVEGLKWEVAARCLLNSFAPQP